MKSYDEKKNLHLLVLKQVPLIKDTHKHKNVSLAGKVCVYKQNLHIVERFLFENYLYISFFVCGSSSRLA